MNQDIEKKEVLILVYYKRRWGWMSLRHVPESALDEPGRISLYKVTPLDDSLDLGRLKKRDSTKAWQRIQEAAEEQMIDPQTLSIKTLKEVCDRMGIPIAWATDRWFRRRFRSGKGINRREERKIESLTPKKFRAIVKELDKLNKKSGLIVKILWLFNKRLGKGGAFVTLESLLRLTVEDIAPAQDEESNWISLWRTGSLIVDILPQYLWQSLCKQINEDSPFVFSNKDGAPLLPAQVNRHIKEAAQKAGIKEIVTSNALRPPFDKKKAEQTVVKSNEDEAPSDHLEQIGAEEFSRLTEAIPSMVSRRGRRADHNPRDLLNAILYHRKTGCPIRKLPNSFPPGEAVYSQYRRWKKGGIIEKIFIFRKLNPPNSTT